MSGGVLAEPLAAGEPDLWRALASPWRRRLLDLLREAPATTGALAEQIPELSRFAVMQHLGVLADAGVVIAERRGRDRVNYINPVPLREWYERWVQPHRVDVVDAVASAALGDHYARVGQHPQVLHDREPAEFGYLLSQGAGRGGCLPEQVEQPAAPRA